MARYALERMPAPEAGKALRDALAKTSGATKAGVIGSLVPAAMRKASVNWPPWPATATPQIGLAAATALGDIGTVAAAQAFRNAKPASDEVKLHVADAQLTVGEQLLAAGDKSAATGRLQGPDRQQSREERQAGRHPWHAAGQREVKSGRAMTVPLENRGWVLGTRCSVPSLFPYRIDLPLSSP